MNNTPGHLQIASRGSRLALIQVDEVMKHLPGITFDILTMDSMGDKDKQRSLLSGVPSDFFTREIDQYILHQKADAAIHSAKDLPYPLPCGLMVAALLPAMDQSDALVTASGQNIDSLPAGARIGTSSPLRKQQLLASHPHLKIISVRGTIEERIAQADGGQMEGVIIATCALIRLQLEHRIAQILPFKTNPLQGHLAVIVRNDRSDLHQLFTPLDCRVKWGSVTIAGFGPGNPELLTLKAERALQQADVLFFDDLLDAGFLEQYGGEKVYVGKRSNNHTYSQSDINEMLRHSATSGKNVVRIKGGDPLIFGRGIEEYHYLKSNLADVLIVPGISSAQAAAAQSLVPLTARGVSSSVAFLSAHDVDKLKIPDVDTLVFYMGASQQQKLANKLIKIGRNPQTPVVVVQNASYSHAAIHRYSLHSLSVAKEILTSPVIITVGWSAANGHSDLPPKWLYTGTNPDHCRETGLIIHAPLIRIVETKPDHEEKKILHNLTIFNRIVFTSRYSVEHFFNWLFDVNIDVRALTHLVIDVIGKTTSEALRNKGLNIRPLSEDESSDGMLHFYRQNKVSGQKILLPRSDLGLSILPDGLEELGNDVTVLTVYRNEKPINLMIQNLDTFSGVVFTSPSAVSRFFEVYGSFPEHLQYRFRGVYTEKRFLEMIA